MHPQSTNLQHISWWCVSMSPSNLFPHLSSYLQHASYVSQVISSALPSLQHVYYVTKAISIVFPTPLKWFPACFLSFKWSQACVLSLSSDFQHVSYVSHVTSSTFRTSLQWPSACFLRLSSDLQHVSYVSQVISSMFPASLKWSLACLYKLQFCLLSSHIPCRLLSRRKTPSRTVLPNITQYETPHMNVVSLRGKKKGKSVPLQAWSGPESSRKLRFPDFMTTAPEGGKVVRKLSWYSFLLEAESTPGP